MYKRQGESVVKGEPLMEIETDKVTVEIEATADGILSDVTAAEGDEIPIGQVIGLIVAAGESRKRPPPARPSPEAAAGPRAPTAHNGQPPRLSTHYPCRPATTGDSLGGR